SVGTKLPVTDASGNASTTVTLGTTSGTDTVNVFADSIQGAAVFTATATPGLPVTLTAVSGNNQIATAGSTLINSLVVQLLDQYANPVPGLTVAWTASSGTLTPS